MDWNSETGISAYSDNLTALQIVKAPLWVSSTNSRETMDILTSCLFTLITCVYNALHLNVSPDRDTWSKFKLTSQWTFIALIAPEIVVYLAASQLLEACWPKKELQTAMSPKDRKGSQQDDMENASGSQPVKQVKIVLNLDRTKLY